jgi:hypothetical protein
MRERPIIFSAPMVRAILDGSKTQTRRVAKASHFDESVHNEALRVGVEKALVGAWATTLIRFPYGKPGDRLWVREAWGLHFIYDDLSPSVVGRDHGGGDCRFYRADGAITGGCSATQCKRWRPGIHMPRWASRIDLEVTDVRVERLQAISEEDARAEGVEPLANLHASQRLGGHDPLDRTHGTHPHTIAFASLWDDINADRGHPWSSSPWVWVVGFRRVEREETQWTAATERKSRSTTSSAP